MSWLLRDNWLGSLLAFFLGAAITWALLDRRRPALATPPTEDQKPEPTPESLAGATTTPLPSKPSRAARAAQPGPAAEPSPAAPAAPAAKPSPTDSRTSAAPAAEPPAAAPGASEEQAGFSQLMDGEPTLFDHIQSVAGNGSEERADVPAGRYGEGSADAVPHQGPPDGFTIKGNAQSMLFHTPDSPYYGRTKPEVWFRTEADAERAGFTKYTRRPRKAADPRV